MKFLIYQYALCPCKLRNKKDTVPTYDEHHSCVLQCGY